MKPMVTQKEYEAVMAERKQLLDVERPAIDQMLAEARREGDLSENADYDSAKRQKVAVEKRIGELNDLIASCGIIKNDSKEEKVMLGDKITVKYLDVKLPDTTYTITGNLVTVNMLAKDKTINDQCAFAKSIMGRKLNDEVVVQTAKPFKIKIIKIER